MASSTTTHKAIKAIQKSLNSLVDKIDKAAAKEVAAKKKEVAKKKLVKAK